MNLKKGLIALALVVGMQAGARAGFYIDAFRVVLTTSSFTSIFTANQQARGTCIYNPDATYAIAVDESSSFSTSITTGVARVPPGGTLCLDGEREPYTGALYGISLGTGSITMDYWRTR